MTLPDYVILLPIPLDLGTDHADFIRLLREYQARRFEGEIARAWQLARDRDGDHVRFGAPRLRALIGEIALDEVRDVLTRDGVLPPCLDDTLVCRAFVAQVFRLRYFSPGARGYFFPAIHDWRALDVWLRATTPRHTAVRHPPGSAGAAPSNPASPLPERSTPDASGHRAGQSDGGRPDRSEPLAGRTDPGTGRTPATPGGRRLDLVSASPQFLHRLNQTPW
ncbi:MAG: hypothetical protein ACUVQI_01725 [Thermochromatium sp.]